MPERWERELAQTDRLAPSSGLAQRVGQVPTPGRSPAGKKIVTIVVAFLVFAAAGSFLWRAFTGRGDESVSLVGRPALPESPFSLWLSADRVPPGPAEIVGLLVNQEGEDATFRVLATVDRWDGREWEPHGELVMCMDHWHCTARIEPLGSIDAVPALGLSAEPGRPGPVERFTTAGLDPGWYRISQEANEGVVAAGIIGVSEGAPVPAPLVSTDAPAISVAPALVSIEGGELYLYPLIPAPSGTQSRQDVLAATRGLSEVAWIERWDGSGWRSVGEVELEEAEEDLARSAVLPALPQGAYRLLRDGPEGQHIGTFWVDGSDPRPDKGSGITSPASPVGRFIPPTTTSDGGE